MKEKSFTKLERYELKYHVPWGAVEQIRRFLEPWCSMDAYSSKSSDGFYWVSTLYLDSPVYTFFRWKEAALPERFNMRIRTYGEHPTPESPRFFEVKKKRCDIVEKTRGTLKGGHAERLWTDTSEVLHSASSKDRKNLEEFYRLSQTWNAHPILLTQYRRIAWFGIHEEYARVTIDTGLRWREERGFDFTALPSQMRPSDLPDYFRPGANAILELKCPKAQVPWWMLDLIRYLNLERTSFSKFGAAVRESLTLPSVRSVCSSMETPYDVVA